MPEPDVLGSDVVIWPRRTSRTSDVEDPTHAEEGTVPGVSADGSAAAEDAFGVGEGPIVWRPATMAPQVDKTVEAPGFTHQAHLIDGDPADHGAAPIVDIDTSAFEQPSVAGEPTPAGRSRAIAVGLLVGAAVGLVIDAFLSGWLHAL